MQKEAIYTDYIYLSKNILSYLLLSKGGINFFSKNFELTMILRDFLIKSTEELLTAPKVSNITKEENFFSTKIISSQTHLMNNKSIFESSNQSCLNNILINTNSELELNDDLVIKINLLQLRYMIELQFVVRKYLINSI